MTPEKRFTLTQLRARKGGVKTVVLTAYTAPMARLLDEHADILLVGDSLGMVVYGMGTTLGVTLEMMSAHATAVMRASSRALVVVDLPFGSYQESPAQAFASAARLMRESGCHAVKLEGGVEMAETIRFLVERGVAVMGHVGLKPQHVHALGGFRLQGKSAAERERILQDALAVQQAGAFSVVLESVPEPLAREITESLSIPTIGIGASAACDGQVLVVDDMLGMTERAPRFVKRYADLAGQISQAVGAYAQDVRAGTFPAPEHTSPIPSEKN